MGLGDGERDDGADILRARASEGEGEGEGEGELES